MIVFELLWLTTLLLPLFFPRRMTLFSRNLIGTSIRRRKNYYDGIINLDTSTCFTFSPYFESNQPFHLPPLRLWISKNVQSFLLTTDHLTFNIPFVLLVNLPNKRSGVLLLILPESILKREEQATTLYNQGCEYPRTCMHLPFADVFLTRLVESPLIDNILLELSSLIKPRSLFMFHIKSVQLHLKLYVPSIGSKLLRHPLASPSSLIWPIIILLTSPNGPLTALISSKPVSSLVSGLIIKIPLNDTNKQSLIWLER